MTLSAKWTVVSFLALTSVAAGSVAFAGCTVTSGNPTDSEGGTVITNPTPDSGGGDAADSGIPVTTCEGNKQTSGDFFNAACQSKLNTECCTELKTCFDIVPVADDAGARGMQDCNAYSKCIDTCTKKTDGTPETDPAKISACDDDCDALSPQNVVDAYKAIVDCATAKASSVCQ